MNWLKILCIALLLTACGKQGVTPQHFAMASTLCEPSGGVIAVTDAVYEKEIVQCLGNRGCETGRGSYSLTAMCKNETTISRKWFQ